MVTPYQEKSFRVPLLDFLVLLSSLLLLKLPIAFGYRDSIIVRLIFLTPLIVITTKNTLLIINKNFIKINKFFFWSYILLLLIIGVSLIRAMIYRVLPLTSTLANLAIWLLISLFIATIFLSSNKWIQSFYRSHLVTILLTYFATNLFLLVMGIQNPQMPSFEAKSVMLSFFGISTNRIWFPTTDGINSFGIKAGVLFVASVIGLINNKLNNSLFNYLYFAGAIIGIITILLADSRGALFASLIAIAISLLLPWKKYRLLNFLPYVSIFLPTLIIALVQVLPENALSIISRSSSDINSLNGRTYIWNESTKTIFTSGIFYTLLGFGYRGQEISGLTERFISLFGINFGSVASAHNSFYQLAIEIGLFGALLFFLISSNLIKKINLILREHKHRTTYLIMLFSLVYIFIVGATESILTIDYEEIFLVFTFILFSVATYANK